MPINSPTVINVALLRTVSAIDSQTFSYRTGDASHANAPIAILKSLSESECVLRIQSTEESMYSLN